VPIGILPTIMPEHYQGEWISRNNRYTALNDSIFVARGEDIYLDIEGPTGERLHTFADSIAPESACTSVQLHLQVSPSDFADHWNAAQAVSAPQVALAANSPFFFGKRLHAETRIELFKQATDTRPIELKNQGVRPRVFFGERWITSIFDLFEENVRYFPALLAESTDEDPIAKSRVRRHARAWPSCNLHNGTVYRWNRPIYDIAGPCRTCAWRTGCCPPGRRSIDVLANAAFYYGLRPGARRTRSVRSGPRLSFAAARENFDAAAATASTRGSTGRDRARSGRRADPASPAAAGGEGVGQWGVSQSVRDRYLSVHRGAVHHRAERCTWTPTSRCTPGRCPERPDALNDRMP
jgi:hypothetical protein